MITSYIAVDLGAQSGRVVIGTLRDQARLEIKEIHRFANEMVEVNGHLHWDIHRLFSEIKNGLQICGREHDEPITSLGIDTWGVDFVLTDRLGKFIGLPYAYRDCRTNGMIDKFTRKMPARKLYQRTGVQLHQINTVFQLYAMVCEQSPVLNSINGLLFMPDIFNYLLTGRRASEFTIATTSQLYNPALGTWDSKIFEQLGIRSDIMPQILEPGSRIADLIPEVTDRTGLGRMPVIAVASHDTGSAVAALPSPDHDYAYISSGTWSLMGIETTKPLINDKTYAYNFTNEGGVGKTFRVLKNITGLYLLQECLRAWDQKKKYPHDELIAEAENFAPLRSIIDPDDPCFFSPAEGMPAAIQSYCRKTGQPAPEETGEFTRCILESLAIAYRHTLECLRKIRKQRICRIHVIGGGSRNILLCQLTADATGLPVHAGPQEATAIGNILVQAMASGQLGSLDELRAVVRNSFEPIIYQPRPAPGIDKAYERFLELKRSGQKGRECA